MAYGSPLAEGVAVTQVCLGFPRLSYYSILYASLLHFSFNYSRTHTLTATFLRKTHQASVPSQCSLETILTPPSLPPPPPIPSLPPLTPITDSLPAILAADDSTANHAAPTLPPMDIDGAPQSSDFLDLADFKDYIHAVEGSCNLITIFILLVFNVYKPGISLCSCSIFVPEAEISPKLPTT